MAFIRVPFTHQFALRGELLGAEIVNTLYFTGSGAGSQVEPVSFCDELISWWSTEIRPVISNQYVLREVYYIDLDDAEGPSGIVNAGVGGLAGLDATSAVLPGSVAACISFRTNVRGRSGRGRNYVAGIPEGAVVGNVINAGTLNPLISGYGNLIGTAAGAGGTWVIASRFINNAPRPVGLTYPVVAVNASSNVIAAQRLRTNR